MCFWLFFQGWRSFTLAYTLLLRYSQFGIFNFRGLGGVIKNNDLHHGTSGIITSLSSIIQALWHSNHGGYQSTRYPKPGFIQKQTFNSLVIEWLTTFEGLSPDLSDHLKESNFWRFSVWYSDHGLWLLYRKCLKANEILTQIPDFGYFWCHDEFQNP